MPPVVASREIAPPWTEALAAASRFITTSSASTNDNDKEGDTRIEAYVAVGIVAVPPMIVATALEIVGTWGRYVPDKVA